MTAANREVRLAFGRDAAALSDRNPPANASYWRGVLELGPAGVAENFGGDLGVVRVGDDCFPVAVHDGSAGLSYPCSLHSQYVAYPRTELALVPAASQRAVARLGLLVLDALFRTSGLDRTAQWSAWLLSTNLHPATLQTAVPEVTRELIRAFPKHAVLVRNIHGFEDPALPEIFKTSGYNMIASRRIYFFDGRTGDFLSKSTVKRDLKSLAQLKDYRQVSHADLTEAEVPRITGLYRMLYVDKHSRINPRYTETFVRRALHERWLEFRGLRHVSGRLDGVCGCFSERGVTSTPFIGYDTGLHADTGLYRHLVGLLLTDVSARKLLLNYSSGAGEFKRRRGGVPVIEYNAVFSRHLPPGRRAAFRIFRELVNRVGKRFLENNDV